MPEVVETPHGPGRLHLFGSGPRTLLLSHGAGGGIEARDLQALSALSGIRVALFEQPWRVAGKRLAPRPAILDEGFSEAASSLDGPLVVGGRSAGARSACRTADQLGAIGVLALSFPLHPPGKPDKSRVDELVAVSVPVLVIQGARDPFGRPEEFPDGTDLVAIDGADHGFKVPAAFDQQAALDQIVSATASWLERLEP